MALAFTVDSISTLPEAHQALYKPAGDKYVLDVDGMEDTANLKSALVKEREAAKTASRQVGAWQSIGRTPEEIQALIAAQDQAERDKLTKNGEWDKLRGQMADQHKTDMGKKDERIGALTKSLERRLIDADAVAAIASAKGASALLLPHVRASVRVIDDGGDFKVQVVDASGNPRVNGKGEFLSIADLVSEMKQSDVFGRAFDAAGTTGSGAGNTQGNSGPRSMNRTAFDALRPAERAKAMASGTLVSD